ncbi:MAG: 23S rRNA (guanosine(2251)-2'-O)-methyltransferase RlmB [Christensenella sp.]|nr:23S rRNA (guanosine(2251)-2'-O)-methyltransferase RlmB [Christensenella sp.]
MPQDKYGSGQGGQNKGSYNRSGDKPQGGYKKTYGDKSQGGYKKTYGDKPQGEGYQGKRSYGDKPQGGYGKPYGERSYDKKPYGDKPQGEGYQGKRSYGDKPQGGYGKPSGERSYDKKPYGDKPQGEGYQGKRSYDKKPYGEKSFEKKPYGNKPYEKKPYDKKASYDDRRAEEMKLRDRLLEDEAPVDQDELPFLILGRNAVKEAIKSERSIDRIEVVGDPDGSLREILALARERKLIVREVDKRHLDEICLPFGHGGKPGNHQGIVAYAAGVEYCTVQEILALAREKKEDPFVIVLDGITDPHNLGSIIRSAECAGAHGVVIGKRRSASVTAATVKASAGATEHVLIARVVNIPAAIDELKRAKLWVAGADMKGQPMDKQGLNGPLALVIGGEGDGLSKLVAEKCDFLVAIPQYGKIGSLNAGVAAGVLMFEKKRQDKAE